MARLFDFGLDMEESAGMDAFLDRDKDLPTTMVSIYDLDFNPYNHAGKYDTEEEIRAFAEEIRSDGQIKEPLVAYKDFGGEKKYMLLSGHRRLNALLINAREYEDTQKTVPVVLVQKPQDLAEELHLLSLYNHHRAMDVDSHRKASIEMEYELFRELKAAGKKPEGRPREWIAKRLGIGEKRVQKFLNELEGREVNTVSTSSEEESAADEVQVDEDGTAISSNVKEWLKDVEKNMSEAIERPVKISIKKDGKVDLKFTSSSISDFERLLFDLYFSMEDGSRG